MLKNLFLSAMVCSFGADTLSAQDSTERYLPLEGTISPDGSAAGLTWFDADPPRVGSVMVNRRLLGQSGGDSWKTVAPDLGPVMRFADDDVRPGIGYEYQVMRVARDIVDVGYWTTGVELPAVAQRGSVHVVVDETLAAPLEDHLRRFERDLTGDGWQVAVRRVPRHDPDRMLSSLQAADAVKVWLQRQYRRDPSGVHAVVLVGHVPVPMSGQAAPDGHKRQPHASDLFYAELDSRWRATEEGLLLENSLPSDDIEMQVGRIDFAGLAERETAREVALLRAYFDKNHHWRMGLLGDLRQAYGQSDHLFVERHGLRNIVGAAALEDGGHHGAGERHPWLWGVDFGHHAGGDYADEYANKAVFAINFGSGKQKIERPFNAMTALLAQPWYPLAVGWGGRPAWWLHSMALGASIGEAHMRTVNNGVAAQPYRETMDYYPTGTYLWRNPVWVNLLGDPTLRAFPLAPPERVIADDVAEGVALSWEASPDPDTIGYQVFRTDPDRHGYVPLHENPQPELAFLDTAPVSGASYMVRAYGLKDVNAGSFYTYSQGAFDAGEERLADDLILETDANQPVPLPGIFDEPQGERIYAIVEAPATGKLSRTETGWQFTPPADFTGSVALRFSATDSRRTEEARLEITVVE